MVLEFYNLRFTDAAMGLLWEDRDGVVTLVKKNDCCFVGYSLT